MNLLHVINSMNPRSGGPCQAILNLAQRIMQAGITTEVVCLDEPNSDYLTQESLSIHALGKGRSSWGYHPQLRPWLDGNLSRFDAVILNGLWLYTGYALLQASRQKGAPPYFVFPHGMLDPWFQSADGRCLKAVRNWFYWKLIEQHVIRGAHAVLFTCAEEMRLARESFHPYQPKGQYDVGLGTSEPPPPSDEMKAAFLRKCPGLGGRPYFLFLGRIHPKKGVDLLLNAYANVHGSDHDGQMPSRLVIAGPGLETAYGQEMLGLATKICPKDSIYWPGMLMGEAKWGALYCAEAFVLPSHQENFGIAVAEALSCGSPVLISNQINIWPEIKKDNAGLVDSDTLGGMEQLFRKWQDLSFEERTAMRRRAKASFENRFGINSTARNLVDIIQDLTARSSTSEKSCGNGIEIGE
jgi:glycosyltransferase involved in cell wall biosynthesis